MQLVFVCTANIARSPYAERRMGQLLAPGHAVELASAGIPGFDGRAMDEQMAAQLEARGASGAGHASRVLTAEILGSADLVLTMTFAHHMAILENWPGAGSKVFGIGQFAEAAAAVQELRTTARRMTWPETVAGRIELARAVAPADSMVWNVPDPYRRGAAAARSCADLLDGHLTQIAGLF